jgi:predicted Zn finger-like uncharacterized protein
MPIRVRCPQCKAEYRFADALADKKVRCKKCQGVIPLPPLSGNDDDPAEPRSKPSEPRATAPSRPSKKATWIALTAAVVLCVGAGLALWFFVLRHGSESSAEESILASWQVDLDATKAMLELQGDKVMWKAVPPKLALEFHKDGTGRWLAFRDEIENLTWKLVAKKDNRLTVAVLTERADKAVEVHLTPKGKDRLLMEFIVKAELTRGPALPAPPKYVEDNAPVIKPRARFDLGLTSGTKEDKTIGPLLLSADGSRLAVSNGGRKPGIQIWDISGEPKKLQEHEGAVSAFSADGKRLVRGRNWLNEIIDADSGKVLGTIDLFANQWHFLSADVLFATLYNEKRLRVDEYSAATGKKLRSFTAPLNSHISVSPPVRGGRGLVVGVHKTNQIKVWDLATQQVTREFPLAAGKVNDLWFDYIVSPDGRWLVVKVAGDQGKVFNGTTGAVTATVPPRIGTYQAAFVPKRDIYLTLSNVVRGKSGSENDVVAYDVPKQLVVAAFRGQENDLLERIAVSGDGRVLAAGTREGLVIVWALSQLR